MSDALSDLDVGLKAVSSYTQQDRGQVFTKGIEAVSYGVLRRRKVKAGKYTALQVWSSR